MKKLVALMLALILCLSLAACGAKEETGAKIAVQKGTTSFMYADALKNTTTTTYDTFALAAKDMINGNADYLFVDKTTAKALQKEITGLKIIEIALSSENYGIGIDKNQADLKTKIDQILTDKADEINAIKEKYMNGEEDKYVGVTSATKDGSKADQQLVVATNASMAVERIGMPEAQIILSEAASYVACAPKSNAAVVAIGDAMQEVQSSGNLPIPTHLQDAHYKGSAKLGHGVGYKYAHSYKNNYVKQQYLPYELNGKEFYKPSGNGYEAKIREHMKRIKEEAEE